MSYNPNIPIITDPILQSSRQIKANFQEINSAFSSNHVGLTQDQTISGMHRVLTLQPQAGDPTTLASQIALYNKLDAGLFPEIFFRPNNNQTPIQLTYPSIKADGSTTQYSFVAGPFVIYGGKLTNPANGMVVTLNPGNSLIYVGFTVTNRNTTKGFPVPTAINAPANSFTVTYNAAGTGSFDVYYMAIGN